MRRASLIALVALCGCGGGSNTPAPSYASGAGGTLDGGMGGSGGSGDSSGSGGSAADGSGASSTSGGSSGDDSGGESGTSASSGTGGSAGTGISPIPGDPGCGLDSAAFCDTFDEIATTRGRAGDLDPKKWSASHGSPQLPTANGAAFAAGPATLPACRPGLPAQVFPSDDTLICDPIERIHSKHLLVAVGSQNYGQNSYRVRQPFDFAGRTGKIVFDAEARMLPLLGWISLSVTEDPAPIPSYSIGNPGTTNDEGGAAPRSALLVQFTPCPSGADAFGIRMIDVLRDYRDTVSMVSDPVPCLPGQEGALSHFEVSVSQDRVDVSVTPFSADGVNFDAPGLNFGADVDLPFSRGYVQLTVHNHATLKYGEERISRKLDAWITRFDNVGFDGPVVENWREAEAPDSLFESVDPSNISGPAVNVGYRIADEANGPAQTIEIPNVSLSGVRSARLALGSWYLKLDDSPLETFALKFRFNGGDWRERLLTAGEIALLTGGHSQGALSQMMDVPLSDLVDGTNTVEFVTAVVPQNYPPAISSIDLVLTTD